MLGAAKTERPEYEALRDAETGKLGLALKRFKSRIEKKPSNHQRQMAAGPPQTAAVVDFRFKEATLTHLQNPRGFCLDSEIVFKKKFLRESVERIYILFRIRSSW